MGLRVDVYRNAAMVGDFTNNGESSRVHEFTLINVEGPSDPSERAPAAYLEAHYPGILRIRPMSAGQKWVQMGGNFAHTSDSRFREACERLTGARHYGAVAIHDRIETTVYSVGD